MNDKVEKINPDGIFLTVQERIALLGLLPREANFLNLKLIREIKEDLSFSEQEHIDFEIKQIPSSGNIMWNPVKAREKKVHIGEVVKSLIVKEIKRLDKEQKLREEHITLYEKFIED